MTDYRDDSEAAARNMIHYAEHELQDYHAAELDMDSVYTSPGKTAANTRLVRQVDGLHAILKPASSP